MKITRTSFFIFLSIFALVLGGDFNYVSALDCSDNIASDNQDQLKERLAQCQVEIQQQTDLLKNKQRESTTLERDLDILSARINKAKLEIKAREINIRQLGGDITKKSYEIKALEEKIDRFTGSAADLIRKTNSIDSHSSVEILLANNDISDFFADVDAYDFVQGQLQKSIDGIRDVKSETEAQQQILEDKKKNEASLKSVQELEKQKAQLIEKEKNSILKETRGQEKKYQQVLSEKQRVVAAIKNKILKFVGGGQLKFPEALALARIPEGALGVRAALILSILTQESGSGGVIGSNIGRCFYNTPRSNPSGTVMSDAQKTHFVKLLAELGLDPDTTPVSCPITSDGAYGGAMGPSQFMPQTWWDYNAETGYKRRVERITGIVPASPFGNLEAFTGTALYLSDALTGCRALYSTRSQQESCAAAKYYAGGNYRKFMNSYGKSVANRADEFQKDIDILDTQ